MSWGFLLSKAVWVGIKAVLLSPPFSWLSRAAHLAPGECVCVTHLSLQAWGVQKLSQPGVQSSQNAFVMFGKVFCCFKERRWRYSLSIICYRVKRVLLVNELDNGRILEIPPRCLVPRPQSRRELSLMAQLFARHWRTEEPDTESGPRVAEGKPAAPDVPTLLPRVLQQLRLDSVLTGLTWGSQRPVRLPSMLEL